MRATIAVLFGTLLATSWSVPASAGPAHPRQGWVVGVAYGPAKAKIEGADSLTSDWLEGPAQMIRLGRMITPSFKLGFEHQQWLREQGFQSLKIRAGVQLEAIGATAYFGKPGTFWGGFYASAGGGWAHARLTFLEPVPTEESQYGETYHPVFKEDEYGWGAYGGVGYEFQLTRTFAASLSLTYSAVDIGGSIYDNAKFVPLAANISWSF